MLTSFEVVRREAGGEQWNESSHTHNDKMIYWIPHPPPAAFPEWDSKLSRELP